MIYTPYPPSPGVTGITRKTRAIRVHIKRIRGLAENVTGFDIQRDLTAHQDVRTRCPCTHSKAIGHYYSREAHKPYLWPRDMAINEHQLVERRIGEALCGEAHALLALL